jgi:hypothetical protein
MHIHKLAVELGSTDRGRGNFLKAGALLVVIVVILSLKRTFFGFEQFNIQLILSNASALHLIYL